MLARGQHSLRPARHLGACRFGAEVADGPVDKIHTIEEVHNCRQAASGVWRCGMSPGVVSSTAQEVSLRLPAKIAEREPSTAGMVEGGRRPAVKKARARQTVDSDPFVQAFVVWLLHCCFEIQSSVQRGLQRLGARPRVGEARVLGNATQPHTELAALRSPRPRRPKSPPRQAV